jgi:CheY-like chemotaxis protein
MLNWTTEKPAVPGTYRFRRQPDSFVKHMVIEQHVQPPDAGLLVTHIIDESTGFSHAVRFSVTQIQGEWAQEVDGVAANSSFPSPARIRVLLVDDHAMVREGLRSVMESNADVEIVGQASNGVEAVVSVEWLQPSVVVMDVNMPIMNGIDATAEIKRRYPEIIVIGLSVEAGGANQQAMKDAGAAMLLTKEAAAAELYHAIQNTRYAKAR